MAIGDTYRLRIAWFASEFGGRAINDFYFRQDNALVFDTAGEDLWEAFQQEALPLYLGLVTNTISIDSVTVGMAPLFETEFQEDNLGITGEVTGEAMPPVTGAILARYTAVLSKRGRGRIYLPPASEAYNTGGRLTNGYISALGDFGDLLEAPIGDGVLTSFWTSMLWSPSDQVAREVVSWSPRSFWGIQRDRRRLY